MFKKINDFIGCTCKCNENVTVMGLNNIDKHQYQQGIK